LDNAGVTVDLAFLDKSWWENETTGTYSTQKILRIALHLKTIISYQNHHTILPFY
jgi:hypothetical protein